MVASGRVFSVRLERMQTRYGYMCRQKVLNFGSIFGLFWEAFGVILGVNMRSKVKQKIGCVFGRSQGGVLIFWGAPSGMRGDPVIEKFVRI